MQVNQLCQTYNTFNLQAIINNNESTVLICIILVPNFYQWNLYPIFRGLKKTNKQVLLGWDAYTSFSEFWCLSLAIEENHGICRYKELHYSTFLPFLFPTLIPNPMKLLTVLIEWPYQVLLAEISMLISSLIKDVCFKSKQTHTWFRMI